MGRITNSQKIAVVTRLNKPTGIIGLVQNGPGETTGIGPGLGNSLIDPECASKVPRRRVRPFAQRQMKLRNGVKVQSLSYSRSRCQPDAAGLWDCLRSKSLPGSGGIR